MIREKTISKIFLYSALSSLAMAIFFGLFYTYWNSASPDRTCASCHEIANSVHSLSESAHRQMHCKECHGTALSNGFHSLKEKGMMVVNHVSNKIPEAIRLNESQLLEVQENCTRCHASEYAKWKSGGHSAGYSDIFLDSVHNTTEQLNSDCLRCHGMFYEGTTADLVKPLNTQGPWELTDAKKSDQPTIPCMACHSVHSMGSTAVAPDYANPSSIFYNRETPATGVTFYDRHEKVYITAAQLPALQLRSGDQPVKVSNDPIQRNCVQCHAPNGFHEAGTSDDRTPRGVHEGLSCMACHEPHSNDAKKSCATCHPALSNCKLDVTTMNTTYADPQSANNIHTVACTDCHLNVNRIVTRFN